MDEIKKEIKELFIESVRDFITNDKDMPKNCSERAKVHRIAYYLENRIKISKYIKGFVVDCEYNKVLINNQCCSKKFNSDFLDDNNGHNYCFMPDLIVHKRNTSNNLLYCEFKNHKNSVIDNKKTSLMTNGKFHIQYLLSAVIVFDDLNLNDTENQIKFKENTNVQF